MIIDATNKPLLSSFEQKLIQHSLEQGQITAFPTDTVYALGASGFSKQAIDKIYKIKGREENKPLILFVDSIEKLKPFVKNIDELVLNYMRENWPGAVTIVLPLNLNAPIFFSKSPSDSVAVRIPKCPVLLNFLSSVPFPLMTTSANKKGLKPLTTAIEIEQTFNNPCISVPFIIDGGSLSGKPSKIVQFSAGKIITLRE
jgi:L-threonylcarbamoyladenylate synthase